MLEQLAKDHPLEIVVLLTVNAEIIQAIVVWDASLILVFVIQSLPMVLAVIQLCVLAVVLGTAVPVMDNVEAQVVNADQDVGLSLVIASR